MNTFLPVFFCVCLASYKKKIRQSDFWVVPQPFGTHEDMIFVPTTTYKNIDKNRKSDALGWIESLVFFTAVSFLQENNNFSGYGVLSGVEWFSKPYRVLKSKIEDFIRDVAMEEFKCRNSRLTISDLVVMTAKKVQDEDYFPAFFEEIKAQWRRRKAQKVYVGDKIRNAYETYLWFLSEESRGEFLGKIERMCPLFSEIFSGPRGLRLMIEMFSRRLMIEMFSRDKEFVSEMKMIYAGATGNVIRGNPGCFDMMLDLYNKYGLSVAAEAGRFSFMYREKSPDEILKLPSVVSLMDKERKKIERNAQELIREEEQRKAKRERGKGAGTREHGKGAGTPASQCGRCEEDAVAESRQSTEGEVVVESYSGDGKDEVKSPYTYARRVSRWRMSPEKIKEYFDTHGPERYRGQDIGKIIFQKERHDLGLVVRVLAKDDADEYFFNTSKGKSALADLVIGGKKRRGILEIGIDAERNVIYHLMFNQFNPLAEEISRVVLPTFPGAEAAPGGEDDGASFRCPARLMIFKAGQLYVLKYFSHEDNAVVHKVLYLHSYRLR